MPTSSSNPSPPAADHAQLRAQLDVIADLGARALKSWRWRLGLREAARWAPVWLCAGPAAYLVARVGGILAGAAVGVGLLVGLSLLGPVLFILARAGWAVFQFRPQRAATLALHDRLLEAKDRLVTADEFLGSADLCDTEAHGAFMRAAVNDARACAQQAVTMPLPEIAVPAWKINRGSWWGAVVAAGLIFLGRLPLGQGSGGRPDGGTPLPVVAEADSATKATENPNLAVRRTARKPAESEKVTAEEKTAAVTPQTPPRRARKEQPMDGQPASGGGAMASVSNSGNQSAGQASSQRGKPPEKKPETPQPEEPEEKEAAAAKPKPRQKKDSGQLAMDSNSGQGKSTSSSSNLNPFEAPEQQDKPGQNPKADVDDDAGQDEDEQEKSTGVNKPMDKTKAPAVDRNLSTQPPQEGEPGNGRGGPSEIKKTRGVPTMILGLPVPDRVPGTPSPGRSKVTQEYTRPKEESHPTVAAQSHDPRTGPIGHIEQPDLLPWRRALVEQYFMSVHQRADDVAAPPTQVPRR
jgi:hypothetical protein